MHADVFTFRFQNNFWIFWSAYIIKYDTLIYVRTKFFF